MKHHRPTVLIGLHDVIHKTGSTGGLSHGHGHHA